MAGKELSVRIKAQDEASATFRKVGDSAKTMGEAIEQSARSGSGLKGLAADVKTLGSELNTLGMGLTAAGAIGVGLFAGATSEAMQFSKAMSNVNSIARLSTAEMGGLRDELLGMAAEFGAAPDMLADGLYEISSSGFDAAEGISILERAVVAAGAGMTDTATSARAITAVLNAYRKNASEAGNVSDVLFKIVDSGVITFEQLANNLGNTLPLAANLGVAIEELGAAYAQLTLSGIGASQAETQIAALMRSALGPTGELTEAVKEYGYASAEAMIRAEGLAGYLQFLADASGGTSAGLMELLGTQEAVNAALVLGAEDGSAFAAMVEEMGGAAEGGAYTLEVFGIQMDNASGAIRMLQAELGVAAVNIGAALEPLVGFGAEAVEGIVSAFNALPPGAQQAAVALGAAGSAITLLAGTSILALPKLLEFATALHAIRNAGALRSLVMTAGRFTAIGAAATVATVAITGMVTQTRDMVQASEDLTGAWRELMLSGETGMADDLENVRGELNKLIDDMEGGFGPDFLKPFTGAEMVPMAIKEGISTNLKAAIEDSRIDAEAFFAWINAEIARIGDDPQGRRDFLKSLADPDVLIQFSKAADGVADSSGAAADGLDQMGQSAEATTTTLGDLRTILGDLPSLLDDLRLEGKFDTAALVDGLETDLVAAFNDIDLNNATLAMWDEILVNLTPEQMETVSGAIGRILDGMNNDVLDSAAIWRDFQAILNDPSMTNAQQIAAIEALSQNMSSYRDHLAAMRDGQIEWLADGANILAWWETYNTALWTGAAAMGGTEAEAAALKAKLDEMAAFRGLIDLVQDLEAAGAALDSVLRTYDQIDAIGQRASAAGSIAENLVGKPGEIGEIDAMLQRWLSTATSVDETTRAYERYNTTVQAGYEVQAANGRVQELLNDMRADQLPLLAEETAAYQAQIEAIAALPALEQRRALAMQDTAVQTQLAAMYSQAYAASVGEIPKEVATDMIVSAAQADPVMKDLLIQFGLIEEGANGEITVNFPNADTTIDSINRLTKTMLALEAMQSGLGTGPNAGLTLAIEVLGEEEALDLYGMVKNADGTYSKATLEAETTGAEEVRTTLEGVRAADGTTAVLGVNVEVGDTVETVDWVYERVIAADGTEAYMVLRADAETGELEEFGRIVESYTDEDQVTHIRVETDTGTYWTTIDTLTGDIGQTATIDVVVDEASIQPVTVPVTLSYNDPRQRFDETGGAGMGLPDVTVTVTADTSLADAAIGATRGAAEALDGIGPSIEIEGDNSGAIAAVNEVQAYDGAAWAADITIDGNNSGAIGAIDAVAKYDGAVIATTYIDIVTRTSTVKKNQHGGIVGLAGGGIVPFIGGEAGPELAYFAHGGVAALPVSGLYGAPAGTYVAPNNTTAASDAGRPAAPTGDVHLHIHGNVYGVDDLAGALQAAIWQQRASQGEVRA